MVPRDDIVSTKLRIPHVRPHLVHRERLIARLEAGRDGLLTLVCAPAGFGKTTLIVDWLRSRAVDAQVQIPVAWLSLDESDNDPIQFIRLLTAAVDNAIPGIGKTILAMTQSPQPPRLETLLTILINELVAVQQRVILVLEDYHVIRQTSVQAAVAFLLEHLPQALHMVIATREDPPFPLTQLRARGALCEVRAGDLRFTIGETAAFLRDVMGLSVSAQDAAALRARMEGWIVGLQLASLSVQGNVAGFIAAVEGSDRNILDYLREEVLAHQRPAVHDFLLRTAVLDRLTGPLCDAILGNQQPGASQGLLEEIERRNLFLVSLDADRLWYRYHPLFANLLYLQLRYTQPTVIPELHRRASVWFEEQEMMGQAIRHALAAADFDRAARLITREGVHAITRGEVHTVLGWFEALPADRARTQPLLGTVHAIALVIANQLERAEARLRDAERHLPFDALPAEAELVRGRVALFRSIIGVTTGNLAGNAMLATEALRLLPEDDLWGRSTAQTLAALAFRASGDASIDAEHTVAEAVRHVRLNGIPVLMRVSLGALGLLYMSQGRLRRAAAQFAEAVQVLDAGLPLGFPLPAFGYGELLAGVERTRPSRALPDSRHCGAHGQQPL